MKTFISGQSGVAVAIDESKVMVISVDDLEKSIERSDIPFLFSGVNDIVELDLPNDASIRHELAKRWKQDRALRLAATVLDATERPHTRSYGAMILEKCLENEEVLRFVANWLYANPLPTTSDLKGARHRAQAVGNILTQFLTELETNQSLIRVVRNAWNSVIQGVTEHKSERHLLEYLASFEGFFRYFVSALKQGATTIELPSDNHYLATVEKQSYAQLESLLPLWADSVDISQRAMAAVQQLSSAQCMRLRRYAQQLMAQLGARARERTYEDLWNEVLKSLLTGPQEWSTSDEFYSAFTGAEKNTGAIWRDGIWQAVLALTAADNLRLKRYAEWRMKGLGRKAGGRDAEGLLMDAIISTVGGTRIWSHNIDLVTHLIGAMRSISSSWREKKGELFLESELMSDATEERTPLEKSVVTDPGARIDAEEKLAEIRSLFSSDDDALRIIELLGKGDDREKIQDKLGLSEQAYAAAVKRIRRKLRK
jgi:hypothetical protein